MDTYLIIRPSHYSSSFTSAGVASLYHTPLIPILLSSFSSIWPTFWTGMTRDLEIDPYPLDTMDGYDLASSVYLSAYPSIIELSVLRRLISVPRWGNYMYDSRTMLSKHNVGVCLYIHDARIPPHIYSILFWRQYHQIISMWVVPVNERNSVVRLSFPVAATKGVVFLLAQSYIIYRDVGCHIIHIIK